MPGRRSRGRQQPFELQCGDHIRVPAQAVLICKLRLVDLVPGRQNHRTHVDLLGPRDHVVIDGVDPAGEGTAHAFRADPTPKTAGGLGLSRGVVVAAFHLGEGGDSFGNRKLGQLHPRLPFDSTDCDVFLDLLGRHPYDGNVGFTGGLQVFAPEIADDRSCGDVAALNGLDDERGARYAVAGRKHALPGRRHRDGVDCHRFLRCNTDTGIIGDEGKTGPLPDREDHGVAIDRVSGILHLGHVQTAGLVETERTDPPALDACDAAGTVVEDLLEGASGVDGDALGLGSGNLPSVGRHLIAALQAGQIHLAPQPDGAAGNVDRHVAAPQHQHPLTEFIVLLLFVAAEPQITKETRIDEHTPEIGAGDRQPDTLVGADGDEHRIVSGFEQVVQVVDPVIELEVYAEIDDVANFTLHDLGGQPELGDPEPQHSSGHGHLLVHRHAVAGENEVLGGG